MFSELWKLTKDSNSRSIYAKQWLCFSNKSKLWRCFNFPYSHSTFPPLFNLCCSFENQKPTMTLKINRIQWSQQSLERQNRFGGLTITYFQRPTIIWLVWWFPGISYSQNLSLFDMTGSYPRVNGLFLGAFVENNQWQLFNIMAVWWNELTEGKNNRLRKGSERKSWIVKCL